MLHTQSSVAGTAEVQTALETALGDHGASDSDSPSLPLLSEDAEEWEDPLMPWPAQRARLRQHLSSLAALSQALAEPLDLDELFHVTERETIAAVGAETFLLGLFDEASHSVEVVWQVDSGVRLTGGTFPLGGGLISQVIRTRQPQLIGRWSREGPPVQLQYASHRPGLPESAITVPILFGDMVLGVISTYSYRADAFDTDDLLVLKSIASQVASAIANLRHSDRLDAQIQRRISESEAIVANMAEALLVVDPAGRLVRLNQAGRTLLCVDGTSLVLGQRLDQELWGQWSLVGAREVAETLAPMIEVLLRGQVPPDVEVELRSPPRRFLTFSGIPLTDPYGALTGCLLVIHDITQRHEIERLKDDMLLIASHDLRLPLTVIKAQAQLLSLNISRNRSTPVSVETTLAAIVGQTDRLTGLLDLLLDLSQIEAGQLQIRRAPMDLRALISTLVDVVQSTTDQHQVELRAPRPVPGEWDERRLQQVVSNLLTNAVKYSPHGGKITVSISATKRVVTVRTRDQGLGLTAEEVLHVFERFYRAQGIRQLEGTGLGLYICQGIVTAHGGRLWVESPGPGSGTTFSFELPRALPRRAHG